MTEKIDYQLDLGGASPHVAYPFLRDIPVYQVWRKKIRMEKTHPTDKEGFWRNTIVESTVGEAERWILTTDVWFLATTDKAIGESEASTFKTKVICPSEATMWSCMKDGYKTVFINKIRPPYITYSSTRSRENKRIRCYVGTNNIKGIIQCQILKCWQWTHHTSRDSWSAIVSGGSFSR